jgi:hypothetical protein
LRRGADMSFLATFGVQRRALFAHRLNRLIIAACAGLAGCARSEALPALQVYEVKGKVLLADGKPLSGGSIYFVSKKGDLAVTPAGKIGPDGTFSVVTGGSGEGAPAVEYKVRIEAPSVAAVGKTPKQPFPERYNDEDSSRLEIIVRAQPNQLEPIQLK